MKIEVNIKKTKKELKNQLILMNCLLSKDYKLRSNSSSMEDGFPLAELLIKGGFLRVKLFLLTS